MSDKPSLLKISLLPWWTGMILIAAVPFLSILRTGPLSSFFLESGSLLFVLTLVLLTVFCSGIRSRPPAAAVWFGLLALFWAVQARWMGLLYAGVSDMAAWAFVILAFLAWACREWVNRFGQETVAAVLAWVLLAAGCVQAGIAWMQYTGAAADFSGWLMYRPGIVEGQLGQRNHLAHYLMWAVLASAYLCTQRRLTAWLAWPLAACLAWTIGLTGSRTVFVYVLGLALLLPLWRWRAGRAGNRGCAVFALAAATVLLFQFAAEPLAAWVSGQGGFATAAERLGNENFGRSGRGYEWRKAWLVFQSAPWFGHGWGSYALQGFLETGVYPTGYRPYENGVLFTHSHNSLLNLLAEMGIVGTALVLGGLAYVLRTVWRQPSPASLFLLAAMSVSLLHSLFEYPLWYIYFLSVFALFVGLMPPPSRLPEREQAVSYAFSAAVAAAVLLLAAGVLRLGFAYQDLRQAARGATTALEKAERVGSLVRIVHHEPMLAYYAELTLLNHIDTARAGSVPEWAQQAARRATLFRPYSHAHKWGLTAYRTGRREEGAKWMEQVYRYYPAKMQVYGAAIAANPEYAGLREGFTRHCRAYYASLGQAPQCPLPPQ
ncbi:MAG: Wzy polymerase domain-containing protein [Conchiformibius sp.]|nr:Wzy polymerase domain-containing protein [Conchiformibius sp.]